MGTAGEWAQDWCNQSSYHPDVSRGILSETAEQTVGGSFLFFFNCSTAKSTCVPEEWAELNSV